MTLSALALPVSLPPAAPVEAAPPSPQLDRLRRVAARCRAARRLDLDQACGLLSQDPSTAALAYADALMRTLRQALGGRPVFYAPGTAQLSFDERWLLRALERAAAGDEDSLAFLIHRRARAEHRRALAFLLRGVAAKTREAAPDGLAKRAV